MPSSAPCILFPPVRRSICHVRIVAGTRRSSSLCLQKLVKASAASSHFLVPLDPAPRGRLAITYSGLCSDASPLPFLPFSSKPRLLLLPVVCQRNLFSLLLVVQAMVPGGCLSRLLQAVEQDSHVDPWVRTLGDLLRQGPKGEECFPPPASLSSACQQQLRCLCRKIAQNKPEGRRKLNWCFSKLPGAAEDVADSVLQGGKRKNVSEESLELDEEREGKRLLLEEVVFDPSGTQKGGDVAEVEEEVPGEPSGDRSAQSLAGAAPENSQQDAAREPRKISQAELAAEVQSFLQVLGGVCFPLPASEPLQSDFYSFTSFSSDARTEAENAAAEGVQRKWLLLSLSWR